MFNTKTATIAALVTAASATGAQASFSPARDVIAINSDGSSLFRTNLSTGLSEQFTVQGLDTHEIIAMTVLDDGQTILGLSRRDGKAQRVFTISNAFNPVANATATYLGTTNASVSTIDFDDNGQLWGASGDGNKGVVLRQMSYDLNNSNFNKFGSRVRTHIGTGGTGGMQYMGDDTFIINMPAEDRIYTYNINTGTATPFASYAGLNYQNNGLELLDGVLYGSLAEVGGSIQVGTFDANGAFTSLAQVNTPGTDAIGFVVSYAAGAPIPAPGAVALLGAAGLAAARRRRA